MEAQTNNQTPIFLATVAPILLMSWLTMLIMQCLEMCLWTQICKI